MCLLHVYYIHSGNKTIFICLKHGTGWMDALPSLPLTRYHLLHNKIFSFSVQHKLLLKRVKSCISVSFHIPSERAPCFKRRKSQQHAPGVAFQATKTEIRRKEVVPGLWAKSQELIISKNKVRGLCLNFSSNFILALQEHFPKSSNHLFLEIGQQEVGVCTYPVCTYLVCKLLHQIPTRAFYPVSAQGHTHLLIQFSMQLQPETHSEDNAGG